MNTCDQRPALSQVNFEEPNVEKVTVSDENSDAPAGAALDLLAEVVMEQAKEIAKDVVEKPQDA